MPSKEQLHRMFQAVMLCLLILAPQVTLAADWGSYANARFGYRIDIPPEFSAIQEADNGDGGMSQSQDKLSQLAVWGSNLVTGSLSEEFAARIDAAKADGWTVSYRRETANWASWSGSQQGRIFYARGVKLCDDQAAFFLIEYPKARKVSFDPLIVRMVRSLKRARGC